MSLTKEEVQKIVQDTVASAVSQAVNTNVGEAVTKAVEKVTGDVKTLAEKVTAIETAKSETGEGKPAGLTADDVAKLLDDRLAEQAKANQKTAENEAAAKAKAAAREKFIKENAAKVPESYLSHIPESDVEEELKAGLGKATAALKADAEKFGWGANIGASASAAGGDGVDVEKMSATQKIAAGLAEGK
jgi:hypothetical protein